MGKELASVLNGGVEILQLCAESDKASPGLILTIQSSLGRFHEIIEDVSKYSKMINRLISQNRLTTSNSKLDLLKQLMYKVELDRKTLQMDLALAYQLDLKDNLGASSTGNIPKDFIPRIDNKDLSLQKNNLGREDGDVVPARWRNFDVAVKHFPSTFSFDEEYYVKLMGIGSAHLVQIIGHSETCIVLEPMETDLKRTIELGHITLLQKVDIMLQIAKAMKHLHDNNMVYTLKTSNILVKRKTDGSFIVKLADFYPLNPEMRGKGTGKKAPRTGSKQQSAMAYCFGSVCEIIFPYRIYQDEDEKILTNLLHQMIDRSRKPLTFAHICETLWLIKERLLTPESQKPHNKIRRVYVFEPTFFKQCNVKDLPIDQLDHIIFPCISIDYSGHVVLMDIWNSISKPFRENDGVDPQNKPFGNLPEDLGVVGQFKKLLIDQGKRFNLSLGIHTSYQGIMEAASLKFILDFLEVYKVFNGIYIQYHSTMEAIDVNMLKQLRKVLHGFTIGLSPHVDILDSIDEISPDMFDHLYLSAKDLQKVKHILSTKIIIDGGSKMDEKEVINLIKLEDLGGVIIYHNGETGLEPSSLKYADIHV